MSRVDCAVGVSMGHELGLTTLQMAEFVARGVLAFEGVVPEALNARFLEQLRAPAGGAERTLSQAYSRLIHSPSIPKISPGTSLPDCFQSGNCLHDIFALPVVNGMIRSLVGDAPVFDHHFLHLTLGAGTEMQRTSKAVSQHNHQDSTIDPRQAFDIQLFYFPQAVTRAMGGTRYIPGSHLRRVSEAAIARYQNIVGQEHVVCPAGSLYVFHMGLWHGAGRNQSTEDRYLYKIRLGPNAPQVRLWNDSDLVTQPDSPRPIFWTDPNHKDPVANQLMALEPWFEADTGRLELINRLKLWRYITGDPKADVDYWLTRVENEWGLP